MPREATTTSNFTRAAVAERQSAKKDDDSSNSSSEEAIRSSAPNPSLATEPPLPEQESNSSPAVPPAKQQARPSGPAADLQQPLLVSSSLGAPGKAPQTKDDDDDEYEQVDASHVAQSKQWHEQQQGYEVENRHVDTAHTVFLYLSIPLTVIVCVLAIALYSTKTVQAEHASTAVASFCAFSAVILSVFLIYCHLTAYTNPDVQRLICRILFMVPIYSIDSLVALEAYKYGNVVGLVRDTYEAYVIYMFYNLMMKLLGGEEMCLQLWRERGRQQRGLPGKSESTGGESSAFEEEATMDHLFPMNHCWKPLKLNRRALDIWKFCLAQYMVLNPLLTCIAIPLYFLDLYKDGDFEPTGTYIYFAGIRFWSVTFAFTSLVYFFISTKDFLEPHKPLFKFAAVKAVVFLSFWQSVVLAGLNHFEVIPHSQMWTADEVTTGMQNFVVCIEMYLAALAHRWVFSDAQYLPETGRTSLQLWAVYHMLSISDVVEEAKEALRITPKGAARRAPSGDSGLYTQTDFRNAE